VQKLFNDMIFPELINAAAAAGVTSMASITRASFGPVGRS
jgi:hypothetical protein